MHLKTFEAFLFR